MAAQPRAARRVSWVEANWPDYAHDADRERPALSPIEHWALSIEKLPPKARTILLELAREEASHGWCQIRLHSFAKTVGMSRNTCRKHLDGLMAAGLVLVKPLERSSTSLGYEIHLIVDEDDRIAAQASGFAACRLAGRKSTRGAVANG